MDPGVEPGFIWIDWIFFAIIALAFIRGLRQGFVKQVFRVLGLFLNLYLAGRWAPAIVAWLNNSSGLSTRVRVLILSFLGDYRLEPMVLSVIGYLLAWAAASIVFSLVLNIFDSVAKLPLIASVNKITGAALGFLKGGVTVFVLASLLSFLPSSTRLGALGEQSYIVAQIRFISPFFYHYLQEIIDRLWFVPKIYDF